MNSYTAEERHPNCIGASWTEEETQLLIRLRASNMSYRRCAERLNRSVNSVMGKAHSIKSQEKKDMSKEEILNDVSDVYRLAASIAWR